MRSGSKLVLAIFGLALVMGILSWLYRYQAAHDSTAFWGPNFALLIAEPSEVTAFELGTERSKETAQEDFPILGKIYYRILPREITSAPGMVHLRHSILTDSNYRWDNPVKTDDWRWCLRFAKDDRVATILFNENFTILGRMNQRADNVRTVDCSPMAETLREYFSGVKAFHASKLPE